MPSLLHRLTRLILVGLATVMLAACGDSDKESAAPSGGRTDIQKYNAYISASNKYTQQIGNVNRHTFAGQHATLSRVVDGTYDFQESTFEWSNKAESQLRTGLTAALALSGKQPGLDGVVQTLLEVLKKIEPLSKDLAYYGETNGSLVDGGAKVKAIAPQLLALLEEAHYAMAAFDDALEEADQALMRRSMEEAKEGSLEKYRLSTVYYGRRIYSQFHAAYADIMTRQAVPPAAVLLEQLQADLQAFDANTQAWLAHIADKKRDDDWKCQTKKRHIVGFLSNARELLQKFQQDSWSRWESTTRNPPGLRWDRSVKRNFDDIISDYNRGDLTC